MAKTAVSGEPNEPEGGKGATTPTEETPSTQEQVDALTARLGNLEGELQSAKDEAIKHQQNVSKKAEEVQDLQAQLDERESYRSDQRLLLGALAEQKGVTENEFGEQIQQRKPTLLQQADALEDRRKQQRQVEEAKRVGKRYQDRAEKLGLTFKDKEYREIYGYVRGGNFEFADAVLGELEKAKEKPVEAEPKETEEEKTVRIEKEIMKKHGLLTAEGSEHSATGNLTSNQVEQMSPEERFRRSEEIAKLSLGYKPLETK